MATALTEPAVTRYGGGGFRLAAIAGAVATIVCTLAVAAPVWATTPGTPTFMQAAASTTKVKFGFTNPVAAGDLLVTGITTSDGGNDPITGVSDTLNGSWTKLTSLRYGNGHVEMYYRANSAAGADTVTFAGPQSAFSMAEYSGVLAGPTALDQFASKSGTGSPSAGPTIAITGANELVIGIGGNPAPASTTTQFSAGTGFTLRTQAVAPWASASGLEDSLSTSAAGQSMTLRSATSSYFGGIVAVFKSAPNASPVAALTVTPASGAAPLAVTADASASTDPVGITGYTFSFGDGTVVGPQPGATVTHTYTAGGSFTVQVTVGDGTGATATASSTVKVGAPVPALSATPSSGATPLTVTADASASTDPVAITRYTFDFGDGSAAVGPQAASTARHTYSTAGTFSLSVTVQDSAGASAVAHASVTAATPPTAALTVSPASGAAPLAVSVDASGSTPGSNPLATYTFDFGDHTSAGPQQAATTGHTYTSGGHYSIKVTATDSAGNAASTTQTVTVGAPTAALTLSPTSGGAPLTVSANASASTDAIGISRYTFDFGDGTPPVGPQSGSGATHTYTATGSYTVTVTVVDSVGASSSATASLTVDTPPTPALTVTPNSGPAPLSITADASASTAGTNPIATYKFDFGDGTVAGPQAAATAGHVYSAGGNYAVVVTVTDTSGESATTSALVTAVAPPTAAVTVTPNSGGTPLAVTADASSSVPGSNPISTYTFDFGDGTVMGPQSGATAAHTYSGAGAYTVVVTVTDTSGASATASASVAAIAPPNAVLTVTPASGAMPLLVTADASSSTPGTYPIATYTFNFGDGTVVGPQAASAATHTYTTSGVFTVTVTVKDTHGVTASTAGSATVMKRPTARLAVTPQSGGAALNVTVDGSSSSSGSNPIATYTFSYGDGSAPDGPSVASTQSHTYSAAGSYTVTLVVTDSSGLTDSAVATVRVVNPPTASLTSAPNSAVAPVAVTGDASGSSDPLGITSYTFDFGDGSPLVGPQPGAQASHTYTTAGNFTMTVTVTDTAQATSSTTVSIAVLAPPTARLTESPISGYAPLSVIADGGSSAAGTYPIATYTFNFGDGSPVVGPQTGATTSHLYVSPGPYSAMLTVTDSQGNSSTATASVTVSSGVLGQDTFTRANQNGWGTASSGTPWAPASSSLSIAANEGVVNSTASSIYELLGTSTVSDANGLVRFSVGAASDTAGIILRGQTNGNMYLARYDGAGHLQFEYRVGTTWTHVSTLAFTPTLGSFYWLRFQLQGSNVNMKVWAYGTTEPAAWTWSGTSSGITGPGQIGLYAYSAPGTPVQFDTFSVTAVGNPIPNSTISGTLTDAVSGAPVAGVQVSTLPLTTAATTNSAGAYSLSLPAGTFTVVFTAYGASYNSHFLAGIQAPANGVVSANQRLTPIPAQTAMDTFMQPNQSNGFGVSTDGKVWANDFARYPAAQAGITSGQAWVDTQASSQTDLDMWMGYQYVNEEVTVDLNMNTILSDPVFQHGARLLARVQNSTTWVLMTIDPTGQDLTLWATLNDNWTQLAVLSIPISTNTWYHAKLDVTGNLVQGKVWAFGATEPGWQITATQQIVNGTGQAGLRTTGAYVQYANFTQTPITQLSGTVTNVNTGLPISNATVTLNTGASTTTNSSGSYSLGALVGGAINTVVVTASGYQTATFTVTPAAGTTAAGSVALSP